ncbi:MAG: protein kinase [Myxococcales bacterium]|nr:protein kinase [Myxococcales bacterium]
MLEKGQRVGPYEIRAFVGQGGMGQVYEAFDPRLERRVALKVISVPAGAEQKRSDSGGLVTDFAARLLREARAVAALNHPNVVNIYDVGEDEGRLYLAMEFVVGHTLRALVGQEVPLERKLRWMIDVARALEAAHRAGIVHRDVKPENVIVRDDGAVKVLDFGIARRTVSASADDQHKVDTITGGGAIAGTPVYMSPEQIKGGDVDARADQFAWGVTAYELLAGQRPWPDHGEVLAIVARILTDPPTPLSERAGSIPKAVEQTIARALAKSPDARFASMSDVADALEPFAATSTSRDRVTVTPRSDDPSAFAATTRVPTTLPVVSKPDLEEPDVPPPAKRSGLARLAVPVTLTAAVLLGAYWVRTRPATPPTPPTPPSAMPISTVPEAAAAFADAKRLWRDGAEARAFAAFAKAIDRDPSLSAAHLMLAILTYSQDPTGAQSHFQSAFQHRELLSERDFALLEAAESYVRPRPDLEEWETRLMSVAFRFPKDPEVQYLLGLARMRQANDDGARAALETAVKLSPQLAPAMSALARARRAMADEEGALAVADQCMRVSPVATVCVEARYDILSGSGQCALAREAATQWVGLEPASGDALGSLANALFATGAPRPAIEEILQRRWAALGEDRKKSELSDRLWLEIVDGHLDDAAAQAEALSRALPQTADAFDHSRPARLRVAILTEAGRVDDAAKVARDYLDRMAAWATYPLAPDPSISFQEPLYRAGKLSRADLERAREAWLTAEDARVKGDERQRRRLAWLRWSYVWGGFAETRAEALEALGHAPETPPEQGRRGQSFAFDLGKAELLAGQTDKALGHLTQSVSGCPSLADAMIHTRARLYLGRALEASGDRAGARREYQRVIALWGKATPRSITAREAEDRLKRLPREN